MLLRLWLPPLLIMLGCKSEKNRVTYENQVIGGKQKIIMRRFDANAGLVLEEQLNKDSAKDGLHHEYEHGKIKCQGYYVNDKKDSTWEYFGNAGQILKKENWLRGRRFGEQLLYFETKGFEKREAVLNVYGFDNVEGDRICNIYFDSSRKFIKAEGTPLFLAYNRDHIDQGKSLELIFFFGAPDSLKYRLQIDEYDVAENKRLSTALVEDTTANLQRLYLGEKFSYLKRYQTKGVYRWVVDFSITGSSSHVIIKDTSSLLVTVK